MSSEPIDIIWHYLILFTLLLELVILNLNVKKGQWNFGEIFGAVLHRVCNRYYILHSPSSEQSIGIMLFSLPIAHIKPNLSMFVCDYLCMYVMPFDTVPYFFTGVNMAFSNNGDYIQFYGQCLKSVTFGSSNFFQSSQYAQ